MTFKKRKLPEYQLTAKEIEDFRSLNVRMDNIQKTIETADKNAPEAFWTAAFKHKDELSVELSNWWTNVQTRLHTPNEARVDANAGCLYLLIDENGNVDATSTNIDVISLDWE